MNYKDHFKQQLINEMAMTGRAYDKATKEWMDKGKGTRHGLDILSLIHSDKIHDLNDRGEIVDTGDVLPPKMGLHGVFGGNARRRQGEARVGKRAQSFGADAYFHPDHLNEFHKYMSMIPPEISKGIVDTLNKYATGIVGGFDEWDGDKPPDLGWRMDAAKNRRYPFYPKNIGGVGGDPIFNAFA